MKRCVLILLILTTGCAMTPNQREAIDSALKGAYAAQLRQDAINAERNRNRAIAAANRPRPMNCYIDPPHQWTGQQYMYCR
jgi:hypothetical protein